MLGITINKQQFKQDISKAKDVMHREITLVKGGLEAYKHLRRVASGKYISNH